MVKRRNTRKQRGGFNLFSPSTWFSSAPAPANASGASANTSSTSANASGASVNTSSTSANPSAAPANKGGNNKKQNAVAANGTSVAPPIINNTPKPNAEVEIPEAEEKPIVGGRRKLSAKRRKSSRKASRKSRKFKGRKSSKGRKH